MGLGLGYGELLVYMVAAAVVIGPKDLPKVARAAGRVTGQAVSYVSAARSRMLNFAEETDLTKLHKEMQETMQQLQAIRSELRSGVNLVNPGPVARAALRQAQATVAPEDPSAAGIKIQEPRSSDPGRAADGRITISAQPRQPVQQGSIPRPSQDDQLLSLDILPVSALAAGTAPSRAGAVPSGADIMLDALAEAEVAYQAKRFLASASGSHI